MKAVIRRLEGRPRDKRRNLIVATAGDDLLELVGALAAIAGSETCICDDRQSGSGDRGTGRLDGS